MICAPCSVTLHSRCEGNMANICQCPTCWQWSAEEGPFADVCPDGWAAPVPVSALTEKGQEELRRFGWALGPEFEKRYMTDAWVFNLVNAVEAVAKERDVLQAELDRLRESQ